LPAAWAGAGTVQDVNDGGNDMKLIAILAGAPVAGVGVATVQVVSASGTAGAATTTGRTTTLDDGCDDDRHDGR
jgi:hypothetical protein